MTTLITGATGFVGRYVADELLAHGHDVILSGQGSGTLACHAGRSIPVEAFDILNPTAMKASLARWSVDAVIHLAGISHQREAANDLGRLYDVNVLGCRHLTEALVALDRPITLLFASSSLVYEPEDCLVADGSRHLINERAPAAPKGAYGQSKLAAEQTIRLLTTGSKVKPYIARPGNHIGPGQRPIFAVPSFAQRIAAADDGGTFMVGSVDVARDFTAVEDIARAYRLILEQQPEEQLFTLGASRSVTIAHILDTMVALSGKALTYTTNPEFVRPGEPKDIVVDATLARDVLGWQPQIRLEDSLAAVYRAATMKNAA